MSPIAIVVPPVALLPLAIAVLTPVTIVVPLVAMLPPVAIVVPHVAVLPLVVVVPPVTVVVLRRRVARRPCFAASSCRLSPLS